MSVIPRAFAAVRKARCVALVARGRSDHVAALKYRVKLTKMGGWRVRTRLEQGVRMVVKTAAEPVKPAEPEDGAASVAPQLNIALQDIWNGIAQDQFFPHYQPKVVLKGMELVGVEA